MKKDWIASSQVLLAMTGEKPTNNNESENA
jgi:hypothetical protein